MATQRIPTTTSVTESALIPAHISQVWHLLKLPNFANFWSSLSSSESLQEKEPSDVSHETSVARWSFRDGTVQEVKLEEHSSLSHYITYSVITSTPAITYTGSVSTIRCYEVTSGEHAGGCFVTWSGNFSSDADADVIEDAKFKRREALADLAKAAVGKGHGKMATGIEKVKQTLMGH